MNALQGAGLGDAAGLEILNENVATLSVDAKWVLRGITSNERYVTQQEHAQLAASQPPLGRPEASCAALIVIGKSAQWWELAQDVRRDILEQQSAHIAIGLRYLPAIARRLHHSRDLGEAYDFVTWFEYAPEHERAFATLLETLRQTQEWRYVEREVDIRLTRHAANSI